MLGSALLKHTRSAPGGKSAGAVQEVGRLESRNKEPPKLAVLGARWMESGDTYSRTLGTTIGSESLTTVFGMGTGVAFPTWSPERSERRGRAPSAWWLWLKRLSAVSFQLSAVKTGLCPHRHCLPPTAYCFGALDTCGQAFAR